MSEDKKTTMQFLFGDRELVIKVANLLEAPVDVIVNPANGGLSHGGGVAGQISQQGGPVIQDESNRFIKEHGELESGMVAYTSAGQLPFKAVIHAVGPRMGEGEEQRKIQLAVSHSLKLCDMHEWQSIAFPAISAGIFAVPIDVSARAFFYAITSFWDARLDTDPEKVIICLTESNFKSFLHAFREESLRQDFELKEENKPDLKKQSLPEQDSEPEVGIVNLDEEELTSLQNDEVNDWFK